MMSELCFSDVAPLLNACVVEDAVINRLVIDSRLVEPGDIFVALKGENFDGDQFVNQAAEQGAVGAIVSCQQAVNIPQLIVTDTQRALATIAGIQRQQFQAPVIALTGSAGKTTCKEMIASILSERGSVLATAGNFNNEIGVPLTLFRLAPEYDFAVIEMGAAKKNDIQYLCDFVKPSIVLVTNALLAHLASFGDQATVAATKGEIFDNLTHKQIAIINSDSPYAQQWIDRAGAAKIMTFSLLDSYADIYTKNSVLADTYSQFDLCVGDQQVSVRLALIGQHNITNAVAAAAAALAAGATLVDVQQGLAKVLPVAGRLKRVVVNSTLTVIDDSYNANPDAVKAAIDVLANEASQNCLVLGVMAELGDRQQALHEEVGAYAKSKAINNLVAIGPFAHDVARGFGEQAKVYDDVTTFIADGCPFCEQGVVLVKGSRSAGLERIVDVLIADSHKEKS